MKTQKEFFNPHTLNFNTSLIKPIKQIYLSSLNNKIQYELWTVLEETTDGNGYKIFYSEDEKLFGLGIKSKSNELICLGFYGSFLNTVSCM